VYQLTIQNGGNEQLTRTMVFTHFSFFECDLSLSIVRFTNSCFCLFEKQKNNMMVIANSLLFLALIVYINPIARFFDVLLPLQLHQIAFARRKCCVGTGLKLEMD
jgi:Ca2+-transporting ATPase